jgi:hypothetical protein
MQIIDSKGNIVPQDQLNARMEENITHITLNDIKDIIIESINFLYNKSETD